MSKEKILVVEDEPLVGEEIREDLERLGYVVPKLLSTSDGIAEEVNRCQPDLILMDIRLEGSADGIDAAFRLKAEFDLPVIFLSAHSDQETLARAMLTAPSAYLLKPFNERELAANIAMALASFRKKPAASPPVRGSASLLACAPLLMALDEPAILLDPSGLAVCANKAALAIFGLVDFDDLRGEPLARFIDMGTGTRKSSSPLPDSVRFAVAADGAVRQFTMRTKPLIGALDEDLGSLVLLDPFGEA